MMNHESVRAHKHMSEKSKRIKRTMYCKQHEITILTNAYRFDTIYIYTPHTHRSTKYFADFFPQLF